MTVNLEHIKAAGYLRGQLQAIATHPANAYERDAFAKTQSSQLEEYFPPEVRSFTHTAHPNLTFTRDEGDFDINEQDAMAWAEATLARRPYAFETHSEGSEGKVKVKLS